MSSNNSQHILVNKKSIIWNMIGSLLNAVTSFVLLFCVTRTIGIEWGGIFSLAFATAQILLTIGKFGVRSFHATDIDNEVSFGTYLSNRVITCAGMLLFAIIYVLIAGYNFEKSVIFVLVCLLKIADAIEDVFHGQLQRMGYLETAGKMLALRNVVSVMVFAIGIYLSRNLFITCLLSSIVSVGFSALINLFVTRKYIDIEVDWDISKAKILICACVPLFFAHFLSIYIYNMPKYALDYWGDEAAVAVYAIIFMPAFVINLFSEFIFKPLLTMIAGYWKEHLFKKFWLMILKFLWNILIISLALIIGAYFVGTEVLSMVYAVDVTAYRVELVLLMVSGGFSAMVYLFNNILTTMRKQGILIASYAVVAVAITILSYVGTQQQSVRGGVFAYLISEIILCIVMLSGTIISIKKESNIYESGNCNISRNK